MLFEATGDSEADAVPNMATVYAYEMNVPADDGYDDDDDDDDDAESCSYDLLDHGRIHAELREFDDGDHADDTGYVHDDDDDDEVVRRSTANAGQPKKSRMCVDSTMEPVSDEREKSRIFWEACLAS
ncbi:hypothetical protein U1Q18_020115 [Sarracenia purpurea var. burkii]